MTDKRERIEFVQQCLLILGDCYRADWSDVDGRALRNELSEISGFLSDDKELPTIDEWMMEAEIKKTKYGYTWSY